MGKTEKSSAFMNIVELKNNLVAGQQLLWTLLWLATLELVFKLLISNTIHQAPSSIPQVVLPIIAGENDELGGGVRPMICVKCEQPQMFLRGCGVVSGTSVAVDLWNI